MKKLTFSVLFILPFICNAQFMDKAYNFTSLDSMQYGSKTEYNFQSSIAGRSSHNRLRLFIGYNINWLNDMYVYLQELGYVAVEVREEPKDASIYKVVAKDKPGAFIKVTGKYDEQTMKIKSVIITGTPDEMIKLFVYYWEDAEISLNKLKKGGYIYQDSGSDRIAFDWKGTNPVMKIYKSPDRPQISFN